MVKQGSSGLAEEGSSGVDQTQLYQVHRSYNIMGMVHSKKTTDCTQYQQIVHKTLKLIELELESQTNSQPIVVIPLDFLTLLNINNDEDKQQKDLKDKNIKSESNNENQEKENYLTDIISTIVMTIKQVLYSRATDTLNQNTVFGQNHIQVEQD